MKRQRHRHQSAIIEYDQTALAWTAECECNRWIVQAEAVGMALQHWLEHRGHFH